MRKECEDPIQARRPALIVTYGNTTRKSCPLDRDVLVLGRAPCCDIGLVSPEVAPVHCVIVRRGDGFCIRDCSGGRVGTRINGQTIHEEALHDGDALQVGTFSFEVHLPPAARPTLAPGTTPIPDELRERAAHIKRLERSRRNLVRLALQLRQRARKSNRLPPSLAELERQAETLRTLQRDCETKLAEFEGRLNDLEKAEREVCDERSAFEQECAERQTRLEKAEHDMVRRQAEVEARLKARWEECQATQARSQNEEIELAAQLDRRSQELNHYARYLRRCREEMLRQREQQAARSNIENSGSYEAELNAYRQELERDRQELDEQICQMQVRQAEVEAAAREAELQMARERAQIAREKAELNRLRDEIRQAKDRSQREGSVRDRLANIRRLKEEMASLAPGPGSAPGDKVTG